MNKMVLACKQVKKTYHDGTQDVSVLKEIDFSVHAGERVAIVGPSGSGKSTLLHLLGGLDKPTSGEVSLLGQDWQKLNEKSCCQLRNKHLGFIYQFHHLLPEFSALENVCMPLVLSGKTIKEAEIQATAMLKTVGLSERLSHRPAQLSGGERQRVAIVRALVHQPDCVLADEPTGNLDQKTASLVFDIMLELNKQVNTALIMVTHDERLAGRMDKVYELCEGGIVS